LSKTCRYQPLKDVSNGGIIILRDTQSDQPETLVETVKGNVVKNTITKNTFFERILTLEINV